MLHLRDIAAKVLRESENVIVVAKKKEFEDGCSHFIFGLSKSSA